MERTLQRVTIGGDEYTKTESKDRFGPVVDYRVIRLSSSGKRVSARLNPVIHRAAIARVEAAIQHASK